MPVGIRGRPRQYLLHGDNLLSFHRFFIIASFPLQFHEFFANFFSFSFQKFDLFLSPTTAFSAPKINEDLQSEHIRQRMDQAAELTEAELAELIYDYFDKSLQLTPYTQLANLIGQPAISLPTHVTATGLPLGIQLLAARGREDLLFQVGEQFEQEGKFKLPESYR